MEDIKDTLEDVKNYEAFCLQMAIDRFMNAMSHEKFKAFSELNFDWHFWEERLDKMGFDWEENNPKGIRWNSVFGEQA